MYANASSTLEREASGLQLRVWITVSIDRFGFAGSLSKSEATAPGIAAIGL